MNINVQVDKDYLTKVIANYSNNPLHINKIYFAGNMPDPPLMACQVPFSRIETVIEGELVMDTGNNIGITTQHTLTKGCVLYLPA